MNFNFGTPSTAATTAAAPTLSFGGAGDSKAVTKPAFGGLSFGNAATTQVAPTLSFGVSTQSPSTLSFGTPTTQTPTLSFGSPAATTASKGFSLGSSTATTAGNTTATAAGFNLAASTPQFSLGTSLAASTAAPSSAFSLSTTPATTTSALSLGGTTPSLPLSAPAATTTVTFSLGKPTTTTTSLVVPTQPSTAVASTAATSIVPGTAMTFAQLEEALNKWTLELEEQEKLFMNQALQLNAWDRLLISNGDKLMELNNHIEKVKQQQQQLDHELDFVLAQQRELEDCLVPLEKELKDVPVIDHDRNHIYQMAENMDTQLKQMSEDLKEIIEHLNDSNKSQDNNDPVAQIGRILNAHMNSLQWIDRNTALISSHLDQINKLHDMHRRDNERSFNLTYD